jgi:hypothetical protein
MKIFVIERLTRFLFSVLLYLCEGNFLRYQRYEGTALVFLQTYFPEYNMTELLDLQE